MTEPPPFDLTGKVALVTGASSGLGKRFALTLAKAGAKVGVAARRADRLAEVVREIESFDGRAVPIPLDVTDPASVRAAVATAETELGPIGVLVNNAGVNVAKPLLDHDVEEWDRVHRHQPQGRLADGAGGRPPHGPPRPWRQHHQYRLDPRPDRPRR